MLKPGDKAPSFSTKTDDGSTISLKDFKGKTVVLYFYPKDMTPGCTQQACDFSASLAAFPNKPAAVLGVSRDPAEKHLKFREKHSLNFPLLVDEDGKLCKAYGVWQEKSLYGRKFMGIVRTTFVIGPTGKIDHVFPKVKVNGHVKAVLEGL